jgi:hypothetical protein
MREFIVHLILPLLPFLLFLVVASGCCGLLWSASGGFWRQVYPQTLVSRYNRRESI